MQILVNLPPSFFSSPRLLPFFAELDSLGSVEKTSCNTPEEIAPYLKNKDAVLMWSWPAFSPAMLDEAPHLRFVGNIDITQEFARLLLSRGLAVSVSRRGFSPAVAEMALALMLACLRRTSNHHAAMWSGTEQWVSDFPGDIDPFERQLTGRRVGIVGFGGVGQRLAQLLAPFETELRVFDPFLPPRVAQEHGASSIELDELVSQSEIVVLCAAANSDSAHLISARQIEMLAPGAVLVNVARASLVDSDALLARLQRGDLFAALDVFDPEPLPMDSPFRALPNAYLSPHRAGGIVESVERILRFLLDDLRAHAANQPRRHALSEAMVASLDA